MLVSESSEGGYSVEFPLWDSCHWRKEGRIFFTLRQRERQTDRQARGVRESLDDDSGPRTTWRWRREGEITHQSMWNLIQLSQDRQHACPPPLLPPRLQPNLPYSNRNSLIQPGTETRLRSGWVKGQIHTARSFIKASVVVQFGHLEASWPPPPPSRSPGSPQPLCDWRVNLENTASLSDKTTEFQQRPESAW